MNKLGYCSFLTWRIFGEKLKLYSNALSLLLLLKSRNGIFFINL